MNTAIGDALFTKAQQKVLAVLFGQPEQSFYLNEVVRLADMGRGAISRELSKLTDAGLLVMHKQGIKIITKPITHHRSCMNWLLSLEKPLAWQPY